MQQSADGGGTPWPIAGHGAAVAHLQRGLAAGRIAHAYLFTGPPGVGRAHLARLFASTLVCQAADSPRVAPCGVCLACQKVPRGVHPDVEVLSLEAQQAASEAKGTRNRNITIESVRALRQRLALRPLEAAWRIAIIEDAETMTGGGGLPAASALLKTLEEPPPFAVLILIAPDAESVLPTLRSRCQQVALGPVATDAIARYLRAALGLEADAAATIAGLAQGRPGWAVAAARDPARVAAREERLHWALALMQADEGTRLDEVDAWATRFGKADWREAERDLEILLGLWRDVLLLHAGNDDLIVQQSLATTLRQRTASLTVKQIVAAVQAVRACGQHLQQNVSPRLALEAMVLAWPTLTADTVRRLPV